MISAPKDRISRNLSGYEDQLLGNLIKIPLAIYPVHTSEIHFGSPESIGDV
jgi:hypothetical protein